jgi:hypothetical protein
VSPEQRPASQLDADREFFLLSAALAAVPAVAAGTTSNPADRNTGDGV